MFTWKRIEKVSAPNLVNHINVMELTNMNYDLTGELPIYFNSKMYLAGMEDDSFNAVITNTHVLQLHASFNKGYTPSDHLLDYYARSFNQNCLHQDYYTCLRNRIPHTNWPQLHINNYEVQVAKSRANFLNNDNDAFAIVLKRFPPIDEITWLAQRNPRWHNLFPIKAFLSDHLDLAKQYRGLLPIGKFVANYFNAFVDSVMNVNSQVADDDETEAVS